MTLVYTILYGVEITSTGAIVIIFALTFILYKKYVGVDPVKIFNVEKLKNICNGKKNSWSVDQIWDMIDRMKIYDPATNLIYNNRYYQEHYNTIDGIPWKAWWWVQIFGHTIPTKSSIEEVIDILDLKNKTTLSVGSGVALWEFLLNMNQCKVISVDTDIKNQTLLYTPVVQINKTDVYEQLKLIKEIKSTEEIDVLFFAWPEPDRTFTRKYCYDLEHGYDERALKQFKGEYVIVIDDIGEIHKDMVGSKECKKLLASEYTIIKTIELPYYHYLYHPVMKIYKRNIPVST